MNTLGVFTVLLLAGITSANPIDDEVLTVTKEFYPNELAIYNSEYDIINLFVPLNSLNFDENASMESFDEDNLYVFFVQGEEHNGKYDYKGLYVLKNKQATKLLDDGKDFAATSDDSKEVYFASSNGIYKFNAKENKAEKYGTLSDSLIGIAIVNSGEYFYVLSEDNVVYKVTEQGSKKEEISDVKDAIQIVLDNANNLYFLDNKKHMYIKSFSDGVVKRIKDLPANPSFAKILRAPIAMDDGVPFIGGKKTYVVYSNSSSEFYNMVFNDKPTAVSLEATLLLYVGYDKKIYQYNILALIMGELMIEELNNLKNVIDDKSEEIKSVVSKPKKSIRAN